VRVRWNYPKFGWIVVMALLFSLCVGGVCTGASKNLQTGLASAGLVATLEGLIVGFLTIYDKFTTI
jgi:Na+/H+-dicarboxylate symporter